MPTQEIIGQDEALSLIDLAVKDDLSCLLVGETGCVSGETEVSVNRAGKGYKTTIAHLYNQMNSNPDNLTPTECSSPPNPIANSTRVTQSIRDPTSPPYGSPTTTTRLTRRT